MEGPDYADEINSSRYLRRDRLIVSGQPPAVRGGHDQSVPAEVLDIQIKLFICFISLMIYQEILQR